MNLDVYQTWGELVKKHTVDGACNFQSAAKELANLVAAAEREWFARTIEHQCRYMSDYFEVKWLREIATAIRDRNKLND
jgi:hypothetical protein